MLDPALYHAHHNLYLEDIPFWLKLAEVRHGTILELGCGTGRLLIPLALAGHPIVGLDHDRQMLQFLAQQLTNSKVGNASYFQADMRHFHLGQQFNLVLLACNTLSTFPSDERRAILESVVHHLKPNGIFATSLPNPHLLQRLPEESEPEMEDIISHPQDGEPVQISSSWQRLQASVSVFWTYDHLLPNGRVDRIQASICHYLSPPEEYISDFSSAGLNYTHLYGGFNLAPYRKSSNHLIILASQEKLPDL